jgi:polysaccharide biosynthesis protein PslH
MTDRPQLLYVSPVIPAFTGNGLAMRAAAVLEALAERCSVRLLVVPLYAPFDAPIPPAIANLCIESALVPFAPVVRLPSMRTAVDLRVGTASKIFADVWFDCVHVFRLAALPYALPYLDPVSRPIPRRWLDLDDVESTTRRRLAQIHRVAGDEAAALYQEQESNRCAVVESQVLEEFDRVYVCSETDRVRLLGKTSAQVCVLPNTIRVPDSPMPTHKGEFSFLFVGTLAYYPNEDAVRYLGTEVLPRMGRSAKNKILLTVAGGGATRALQEFAKRHDVNIVGQVRDVRPWYEQSAAVVAPIRAGGGTRIKILEAFAFRRPVVSTSLGVEGIDVRDGEHVLLADDADSFAEQCLTLWDDPALAARLVDHSYALVMQSYTLDALRRSLSVTFS